MCGNIRYDRSDYGYWSEETMTERIVNEFIELVKVSSETKHEAEIAALLKKRNFPI